MAVSRKQKHFKRKYFEINHSRGDQLFYLYSCTVKPRVPEIYSVKNSNGNFEIKWKSNMEGKESIDSQLSANVTYFKKGETNKVRATLKPLYLCGSIVSYSYFPFMPDVYTCHTNVPRQSESLPDSQSKFRVQYNICGVCAKLLQAKRTFQQLQR